MRVEKLRQSFAIDVVYRHFPLHPDTPPEGQTLEVLFQGRNIDLPASKARMSRLMAEEGLPYGDRTMTYNSRLAQELAAWAATQPDGEEIHDHLFRSYFVDNKNLAVIDNLASIAGDAGLSPSEARRVLGLRSFREVVDADWNRARRLGVTGVPTFVINGRGLVGAQPYEQLVELVRGAGARRRDE